MLIAAATLTGSTVGFLAVGLSATSASGTIPHYKVVERTFIVTTGHQKSIDIACPAGMKPVGGGAHYGTHGWPGGNASAQYIAESDLDISHRGWEITAVVTSPVGNSSFTADAICAAW
jgi:hypothetical protein